MDEQTWVRHIYKWEAGWVCDNKIHQEGYNERGGMYGGACIMRVVNDMILMMINKDEVVD